MTRWTWDPAVLLGLTAAAAVYGAGISRRPRRARRRIRWQEITAFYVGLTLLAVALVSPIDAMSQQLFCAHMVQHLLIGLVAPLLIVLGRPFVATRGLIARGTQRELYAMVRPIRRGLHVRASSVGWSLAAVTAHIGAFWMWHAPPFYDAAVRNNAIHAFEHATFLATGIVFWSTMLATRWRERSAVAVLYLFVAGLTSGALAALLTLAPYPLYSVHTTTTAAWHLTPLEDQQLAGAIMWVPGGIVYVGAALVLFIRWLQAAPSTGRPFEIQRARLAGGP